MNLRKYFYKPLLVGLALIFFACAGQIQQWLNRDRGKLGFTRVAPLENAPPVLAFTTVALGGFRGLIANALWIRASELQEQEKFFEMVQLADWITKLEPHYVQVWLVQAWNMAWNVSVKFKDPQDRWRWVQRGMELLRDQGLRYNPDETLIYRELAWIFQNKIGYFMDDAHNYYKQQWGRQMQELLGTKPNFAELIMPQTVEAKKKAAELRDRYKMDPLLMQEVDKLYGPLEWRLPDAHAIYWAEAGRRKAKQKDQEMLRRVIYQCMQQAFFRGGLTQDAFNKNNFVLGPNLQLVSKANESYEKMMAADESFRTHVQTGHRNFLKQAIYLLYADNRTSQASYWLDYLKKTYPEAVPANITLEDYALSRIAGEVTETDQHKTTTIIEGLLRNGYLRLSLGEDQQYENYRRMAQRVWQRYQTATALSAQERVGLKPLPQLQQVVLSQLLDPEAGLAPEYAARLRTALNLAAPTNAAAGMQPKN
jgi:hypothetical protein